MLLAAGGGACFASWGKDLLRGASAGLHERGDTLAATADTIVASAVRSAARAYGDSLQPRLDTTLEHLSRSVSKLLRGNASALRDSLRPALDSLLQSAGDHLVPLAGRLADTATGRAVLALNAGLVHVLQPTLHNMVRDARLQAESTVRVIRAQAESTAQTAATAANKPLGRLGKILWLVGGIGATGVVGFAIFVWWSYRRSQQSLALVAATINQMGPASADLKQAIKVRAREERVEPWLHGFLAKRGLA